MTVHEAVKELRRHVGESQQIFATRLKMSMSSLQNYEQDRIPEPKKLFTFLSEAAESKRWDLYDVFSLEFWKATGVMPVWRRVSKGKYDFVAGEIVTTDPIDPLYLAVAKMVLRNPVRRAEFLQFAAPEFEELTAEK